MDLGKEDVMRLMKIYHFNLTSDKRPEKVLPFLISLLSKIFISFSHLLKAVAGTTNYNIPGLLLILFLCYRFKCNAKKKNN